VEDFDGLGEIVVEDIVRGKHRERVRGVMFGARVETGSIYIETGNRADAVGFALECIGGGLGIGKDDMLQVVAIARFVDDEAFHIPEVAFEVGEFTVSECGVVTLSDKR